MSYVHYSVCIPQIGVHWDKEAVRWNMFINVYIRFNTMILYSYTTYIE